MLSASNIVLRSPRSVNHGMIVWGYDAGHLSLTPGSSDAGSFIPLGAAASLNANDTNVVYFKAAVLNDWLAFEAS